MKIPKIGTVLGGKTGEAISNRFKTSSEPRIRLSRLGEAIFKSLQNIKRTKNSLVPKWVKRFSNRFKASSESEFACPEMENPLTDMKESYNEMEENHAEMRVNHAEMNLNPVVSDFCTVGTHFCAVGAHFCTVGTHSCTVGIHSCTVGNDLYPKIIHFCQPTRGYSSRPKQLNFKH